MFLRGLDFRPIPEPRAFHVEQLQKTLDPDELETLREAHRVAQILETKTKKAVAEIEVLMAEYFVAHRLTPGVHSVCMSCGAFLQSGSSCTCGTMGA